MTALDARCLRRRCLEKFCESTWETRRKTFGGCFSSLCSSSSSSVLKQEEPSDVCHLLSVSKGPADFSQRCIRGGVDPIPETGLSKPIPDSMPRRGLLELFAVSDSTV